jgi:hypothetical protein
MRKIWLRDIAARSPKAIRYFQSQTKGVRTELDKAGHPLGCEVCTKKDPLVLPQTLYKMEKSDGSMIYLCGPHYVEIAKLIQQKEKLRI